MLTGQVVAADSDAPIAGAELYLYQTNQNGNYQTCVGADLRPTPTFMCGLYQVDKAPLAAMGLAADCSMPVGA